MVLVCYVRAINVVCCYGPNLYVNVNKNILKLVLSDSEIQLPRLNTFTYLIKLGDRVRFCCKTAGAEVGLVVRRSREKHLVYFFRAV